MQLVRSRRSSATCFTGISSLRPPLLQAASHCAIGAAAVHESAAMQKKERSLLALGTRMSWESCWPG
jgi:hypothetical protein